jgi:hypothetical protein
MGVLMIFLIQTATLARSGAPDLELRKSLRLKARREMRSGRDIPV